MKIAVIYDTTTGLIIEVRGPSSEAEWFAYPHMLDQIPLLPGTARQIYDRSFFTLTDMPTLQKEIDRLTGLHPTAPDGLTPQ